MKPKFIVKMTFDIVYETIIEVDPNVFKKDFAQELLDFFSWDYDRENDPVFESVKKHCFEAFRQSVINDLTTEGVIREFKKGVEGFAFLDGEHGLKLLKCDYYELDEDDCEFEITKFVS